MLKAVHLCLCTFLLTISLSSQNVNFILEKGEYDIDEIIALIDYSEVYTVSYNPEVLKDLPRLQVPNTVNNVIQLVELLEDYLYLDLEYNDLRNRIIITKSQLITISGLIVDSLSGESLPKVGIFNQTNFLGDTNLDGFFSITISNDLDSLEFDLFGYKNRTLAINSLESNLTIRLSNQNTLEVTIRNKNTDKFEPIIPERDISRDHLDKSQSISGSPDVFAYLRMLPGVSVGSEGQNGLSVRGGSPDQNLILMDGIQIYEASHLGGLSSVFISDAIKHVEFYKSGFPSRLGGKLSSVLDVRLKDGNRNTFSRSVSMGIEGFEGHIEGPLGENTSINLNGKFSWFSLLASPLIENNLDFNNSTLRYSDGYAKFSHWFSPSNRLSFSLYNGEDVIRLTRNDNSEPNAFNFTDVNRIDWGNRLFALNWNYSINDKLFLTSSLGVTNFNYSSRGSYNINYTENDTVKTNSFDILSNSDLRDISLQSNFEYYSITNRKIQFWSSDYPTHKFAFNN